MGAGRMATAMHRTFIYVTWTGAFLFIISVVASVMS
jgi:hypothetical protein